ncbi:IS110 family transposase [Fulvivirgaceae bacterium PWU5]|jgi:transposase|uniref:IS110 family transposase n=1 Tax=Dawidia cretensis TaxID=2782350 RepID=A0AAP2E529_9BACT|nr:IS110 family transposase [Dawidia cretensis]MBT1712473.1 IS110 family transposase [Dawidia cretensis]
MEHVIYSIGLDVDKHTFKASFKSKEGLNRSIVKASREFPNNPTGFKELHQWVQKHRKAQQASLSITMEATGVYHDNLAWHLHTAQYVVHIVLPTRAKRYMQSMGIKSKNDQIDAQGLADMGMQQELEPWKPASPNMLVLRSLTRQVEMFQETRTTLSNQLEAAEHLAFADDLIIKNLESIVQTMEENIKMLKERITETIQKDPVLSGKYELVKPLKGMGILTFATIVAETGGFELFKNQKQLVSYAGYDVVENQSGGRIGKTRISKQGNAHIRRILFMASFNMVKYQISTFYQLYERVYDRTKIKMKGYVAIQRKLLCLLYTLWKKDTAFDPNHLNLLKDASHAAKNKVAAT